MSYQPVSASILGTANPDFFNDRMASQREFINRQFPTLAFHFFSVAGRPDMMAVRIMPALSQELPWPYAKRGVVGGQQLWEEVPIAGFPDEAFLLKCMLIA